MNKEDLKVAVIRQELVELTGDYRQALILNQIIYWTLRVRDYDLFLQEEQERETNSKIEFRKGWIYKTAEELSEETMLGLSSSNMRKHIKILVLKGWLRERRNPKYKWDKTLQYRLNTFKLKKDLYDLGYLINICEEYRVSVLEHRDAKTKIQNEQNETAIPKITTKTTLETTKNKRTNGVNRRFPLCMIFIKEYENFWGELHPKVTYETLEEKEFIIQEVYNDFDLDEDDYVDVIHKYFNTKFPNADVDYRLWHFATEGVLTNRCFEVGYSGIKR